MTPTLDTIVTSSFPNGASVEVLDCKRQAWRAAVVVCCSACLDLSSRRRYWEYEVHGRDCFGEFEGTWHSDFVREVSL